MTRTRSRKWTHLAQEATRLAGLGLARKTIAERIGVDQSTITRWIKAGKVPMVGTSRVVVKPVPAASWADSIRQTYALDATDEELVRLGVAALDLARNPKEKPYLQLNAMGRFQAIVKQLRLVARPPLEDALQVPAPAPAAAPPARRDPRAGLMADPPKRVQ
jgi:hypothetical protein